MNQWLNHQLGRVQGHPFVDQLGVVAHHAALLDDGLHLRLGRPGRGERHLGRAETLILRDNDVMRLTVR